MDLLIMQIKRLPQSVVKASCVMIALLLMIGVSVKAQTGLESPGDLKSLSIEELLNLEVTLVSRSPLKLSEAASAVQVITGEDIRNSGATNIAEALRLVSNLQVAQLRSNAWLVGSRGFNTLFANKLLVMIDGRTVYTPLFAGVFWDIQNVFLEDVDRIEVVSGPGGTLWGANAVNGVINIITKNTSETQGIYASAAAGSFVDNQFAARYGGKVGKNFNYKIHGHHIIRDNTDLEDGTPVEDAWNVTRVGFKMDWQSGQKNSFTVQGDYIGGNVKTNPSESDFNAQNILARYTRNISPSSSLMVQVYYDRYFKGDAPGQTSDEVQTGDVELQHKFLVGKRNRITWGIGYRRVADRFVSKTPFVAILPERKNLDLANLFIQDEIRLTNNTRLTLGTKINHNVYTGIEVQPGARFSYLVNNKNTLWAAVSRAVRVPSRIDRDYFTPVEPQPANVPSVFGGPDFESENLVAYEAGYRVQPNARSTFSIAGFYNDYDDIYSLETLPGTQTYQAFNGTKAWGWGMEFSGTYQVMRNWRLRFGYTYIDLDMKAKPGHTFDPSYLANDVKNQVMIHSMANLPLNLHLDIIGRYLSSIKPSLATTAVPEYFNLDARLAYRYKFAELSIIGQNLLEKNHREFGNSQIPRGYYVKLVVRL